MTHKNLINFTTITPPSVSEILQPILKHFKTWNMIMTHEGGLLTLFDEQTPPKEVLKITITAYEVPPREIISYVKTCN